MGADLRSQDTIDRRARERERRNGGVPSLNELPAYARIPPMPGQRDYSFSWPPAVQPSDAEALAEHVVLQVEALTGRLASAALARRSGR